MATISYYFYSNLSRSKNWVYSLNCKFYRLFSYFEKYYFHAKRQRIKTIFFNVDLGFIKSLKVN